MNLPFNLGFPLMGLDFPLVGTDATRTTSLSPQIPSVERSRNATIQV